LELLLVTRLAFLVVDGKESSGADDVDDDDDADDTNAQEVMSRS